MKLLARLLLVLALAMPGFASAQTAPPPTCTLQASAARVAYNTKVKLTWTTANATSGYLTEVGIIAPNGSAQVVPGKTTTYAASFTGPGGTVVCRTSVAVIVMESQTPGPPIDTGTPDTFNPPEETPKPAFPTVESVVPPAQGGGSGFVGGIVPAECRGKSTVANCDLCSLAQLVLNVSYFLLGLTVPAAALLFAWAGILYFSARGNPTQIDQAHKVFKKVAIGLVIALSAWALIGTAMSMLIHGGDIKSWDWRTLDCKETRKARLYNMSLSQYLTTSLPTLSVYNPNAVIPGRSGSYGGITCAAGGELRVTEDGNICVRDDGVRYEAGSQVSRGAGGSCPPGYVYTEDENSYWCQNPTNREDWVEVHGPDEIEVDEDMPSRPSQILRGNCSLAAAEEFGIDAAAMACIAAAESSCNPVASGDNGFSIGLYQINMTANNVTCNGQTLPCPSAYSERYTCRNGVCTQPRIINQQLHEQCREMLQNPSCNVQTARSVLNTPRGLNNWSTYRQCRI